VLNLLLDIKEARGIAYIMITHDISIARAFADRVAVMRRGEIVESGPVAEVLTHPRHDYTRRLLAAVPQPEISASS
jgi:ABC-type dipeptide/oligopeptide/nickel transport system ATPase component